MDNSFPIVGFPKVDAKMAAAATIARYLEKQEFVVPNRGAGESDHIFKLNYVNPEWPDAGQDLNYPCGSIIETAPTPYEYEFSPRPDEETVDRWGPGTVVWITSELSYEMQLDLFTGGENALEERIAIAARLPAFFNNSEQRAGVVLLTNEDYFCRRVRVTLESAQRVDNSSTAYEQERRLMCQLTVDIEDVHLRQAQRLLAVKHGD